MTSKEFILWLKGFTEGVHEFNITPKQWDILKERLDEVEDEEDFVETPGMFEVHREPPYSPYPPYYDPYNPFKVTCNLTGSGTTYTPGFAVTTTPNTQGYITTYNPITFTTTRTSYPSGSSIVTSGSSIVTYTTNGAPNWYTTTIANEKTLLND